jgi:hypothetical protein
MFSISQDLEGGGLNNYTKGYCDTFEVPAGIYTLQFN